MKQDETIRKSSELRLAVCSFVNSFPADRGGVVSNIETMKPIIDEFDIAWHEYISADSAEKSRKMHNRIRAKMQFLRSHLKESVNSCGLSRSRLSKYHESHSYIEKKLDELQECIPERPKSDFQPVQLSLDEMISFENSDIVNNDISSVSETGNKFSSECSKSDISDSSHELSSGDDFIKKANELSIAVSQFVQMYPGSENSSIVQYIRDIGEVFLPVTINMWGRYINDISQEMVDSHYDTIKKHMESIKSYLGMSMMISDNNDGYDEFHENQIYIQKKIDEYEKSFPCRPRFIE